MSEEIVPPEEDYTIRCPRLGHQITFSYCLQERGDLPCFKTLDCWYPHFDVQGYFRQHMTQEQWEKAFTRSGKTKVMSLLDLIEEAKQRTQSDDGSNAKD